jgi:hypothetical protein
MKTLMNEKDLIRLEQVSQFLDGTQAVAFTVLSDKKDRYQWLFPPAADPLDCAVPKWWEVDSTPTNHTTL